MTRPIVAGCLLGLLALVAPLPAEAVLQLQRTVADRPAATLLLPYFQVDPGDPEGITTSLTVNNASGNGVLTRVVIWSDLAVPVLGFNVYLTGYDVQRIDLRDILAGVLPRTASVGQDPGDAISPVGPASLDANFPSCAGVLPPPPLSAADAAAVRAALSGAPSALHGGNCCGRNLGDGQARGFVTVDAVNVCSAASPFPGSTGYFAPGGTGVASNQNVLWGEYTILDQAKQTTRAVGGTLVHIRADVADPLASGGGDYTFYGRTVSFSGTDNRLPLPTTFAARYFAPQVGGELLISFETKLPFTTYVIVWRDPKVVQSAFPCGTLPAWFPLSHADIVAFDEQENPRDVAPPAAGLTPFPAATQAVPVNGPDLPADFDSGWIYLNLNTSVTGAVINPTAQAWVEVIHDAGGRLAVGYRAVQFDNAATTLQTLQPGGQILLP